MRPETQYNQVVAIYGYQAHPQYGEWVLDQNEGPRPCLFDNWTDEDLVAFVGGKFATNYYTTGVCK